MTDKIKFIWDFHGMQGKPTAEHHAKHLGEFLQVKQLDYPLGVEQIGAMHHIAYIIVDKEMVDNLRAILKPNRGQYFEG